MLLSYQKKIAKFQHNILNINHLQTNTSCRIMKKLFLSLFVSAVATTAMATDDYSDMRSRSSYINIGFGYNTFEMGDFPEIKSNYGGTFTVGNSYYFHNKPIGGHFLIGLDATWCDLNFAEYDLIYIGKQENFNYELYQATAAMQVGPSITYQANPNFKIHGYFRYAPGYSVMMLDDDYYGGFSSAFVGGGAIAFKAIGVGIEARFGECEYSAFDGGMKNLPSASSNGYRAYISFRF